MLNDEEMRVMLDMRVLVVGAMALMIAIAGSSSSKTPGPQSTAAQPQTTIDQMLLTARCPPVDQARSDCNSDITGSIARKHD